MSVNFLQEKNPTSKKNFTGMAGDKLKFFLLNLSKIPVTAFLQLNINI